MEKISDYIRYGPPHEVLAHLEAQESELNAKAEQLRGRRELGEASIVLPNILRCAARQLAIVRGSQSLPVEVAAGACRTSFELFLRARSLELDPSETVRFATERIHDEVAMLSAALRLTNVQTSEQVLAQLTERKQYLEAFLQEHHLEEPIRRKVRKRAEAAGVLSDYENLYSLYSNYTHATSWLVNTKDHERDGEGYRGIFLVNIQLYVGSTLSCVERIASRGAG